jgi:hypothetical protein
MPLAPLIGALIEGGRADEAWGLLADRDLSGELPSSRPFSVLLLERAWLRQERGDLEGALADLGEARRRIGREGASPVAGLDGRLREVEVLRLLARAREAREAAADALAGRAAGARRATSARLCAPPRCSRTARTGSPGCARPPRRSSARPRGSSSPAR